MTKKQLEKKVEELERRVGDLERRPLVWPWEPAEPDPYRTAPWVLPHPPQRVVPDWTYRPVPPYRPWEITC